MDIEWNEQNESGYWDSEIKQSEQEQKEMLASWKVINLPIDQVEKTICNFNIDCPISEMIKEGLVRLLPLGNKTCMAFEPGFLDDIWKLIDYPNLGIIFTYFQKMGVLEEDASPEIDKLNQPGKSKRGPRSRVSSEEKRRAILDWDRLDRDIHGTTLEEFLEARFGVNDGILSVAASTFYGWRRELKNS